MFKTPFLIWSRLAIKTGEMALGSAQVIAHRTARLSLAGGAPVEADRREFALMGREKGEAALESARAMGWSMVTMNQQFAALAFKQVLSAWASMMSIATSRTPAQSVERQAKFVQDAVGDSIVAATRLSGSGAKVARSALHPVHKRVASNVVRLGKKKK